MKRIAIVGAGISGLFFANLLKKNPNYQITIYEKKNKIDPDEGYGIQLSVNSIKLLNEIGFKRLEENKKFYPEKIDFYYKNKIQKICELEISKFNLEDCRYTTLKRSVLINFLKKDLADYIKTGRNICKIDQQEKKIKLTFDNGEASDFDYLVISDGVFSKSKSLVFDNQIKPKYNNTLAIRGILKKKPEHINCKNISLSLNSNFHYVIYPVNSKRDLNFIAIIKYKLSIEEQGNYMLFSKESFIEKVLKKFPGYTKEIFDNLGSIKIFPVFVSQNFYELKKYNIHMIGDAFFAFSPSFAQGASQSIEGAYELFKNIENKTEKNFFDYRRNKTRMINNRSKFNQFAFHLRNPIAVFFRNLFLKKSVKSKKFLEAYLGKIYR